MYTAGDRTCTQKTRMFCRALSNVAVGDKELLSLATLLLSSVDLKDSAHKAVRGQPPGVRPHIPLVGAGRVSLVSVAALY